MTARKTSRFWFLTAAATGVMLNPLNSSMISLALNRIQTDFQLSFSTVSWLISAFYLSSVIAQPIIGKLGDHFGKKFVFMCGLLLVAISALGAPWAPTFMLLLVMRLLQSVGSSAIYPAAMGLVRGHIRERQASALAVISVFTSATAALGPTIGGILVDFGDWPAIFIINFPVVLLSVILGMIYFPRDERSSHKEPLTRVLRDLDIPGILLFAAGMALLVWFLLSLTVKLHPLSGIGGAVLLGVFIWREWNVEHAFIDIRMFQTNQSLGLVMVQFIMLNIFNYALFFGLPSYFQDELHFTVKASGYMMLLLSGFSMLITLFAGRWVDRSGFKKPLVAGTLCMLVGAILLATLFVSASIPVMACILALVGISYGLGNISLQAAMVQLTPPGMIGTTSGLFQASRYMGSILSSVALGLVFSHQISAAHFRVLAYILIAVSVFSCLVNMKLREAKPGLQTS
ncbi:MFS transporter [Brevibacillus fulvus]|uniref:MFS family permease n=1 Tax=Brevibacillus fulvus TaxID=1125967 RepID=A0A938Y1S8_9BACL|nr:MFS transporter [Brevibacillus fulvus]MBM7589600.1 MFS family permease [Brevibacillus fulvus]